MTENAYSALQDKVDRVGVFKATLCDWGLIESQSSDAKGIKYAFSIERQWDDEKKAWGEEWPIGWFAEKVTWFLGKGGKLNDKAVNAMDVLNLWPAKMALLSGRPPEELQITYLVTTEHSEYNGYTNYDISWVNENADEPRGGTAPSGPTHGDADTLKSLDQAFGGQLKAMRGKRPAGSPGAPGKASPPKGKVALDQEDAPF